ncbi:hypothetical protein Tco_0553727 [Tanacetum coccineum]
MKISLTYMNANKLLMFKDSISELTRTKASIDNTSGPVLKEKKSVRFSALYLQKKRNLLVYDHSHQQFVLVENPVLIHLNDSPSKKDYDILFQPLFDEYFQPPSSVVSPRLPAAAPLPADTTGTPSSTTIDQDAPSASTSPTTQDIQAPVINQDPSSEESSSRDIIPSNFHQLNQSFDNLRKWTKDHPLDNAIGNLSRPVSTRSQLQTNAIWCYLDAYGHMIPFSENSLVKLYYV